MIAKFPIDLDSIEREFSYPIILKKSSGSQGKGVMLVQNRDSLKDISEMIDTSKPLIFQEYVSVSRGRDLRVFVIGGKVVGGMMRVAKKGFKANFSQGGYVKPVKLSPAVEWLAIECSKLCKLDIAGVDILIDQDTYKICEINASPGFKGFELATGLEIPERVIDFVKLRLGLWRKNQTKKEVVTIPIQAEHLLVGSRVDVDLISPRVPNDDKQIV
jgi:RimK family alpha-L-glutamate ligase